MVHGEIARAKLAKAKEFLLAAQLLDETGLNDAIVSLCASAAINASDALIANGGLPIPSGQEHGAASTILRRVSGSETAKQFQRVVGLKHRAQYSAPKSSAADAAIALRCAERLVDKCEGQV